ncbi:MAG: ABC transporter substrate-binding protein [Rhizobiales bacterium]|nr:ABC transporter substrate-binding protein [Hyphomicrobiales bacterium]
MRSDRRAGDDAGLTRRQTLALGAAAALLPAFGARAAAGPAHGFAIFSDLKYAADFAHFDYVNPDAPKGGRMVTTAPNWAYNQNALTFNTLNGFANSGDAAPRPELTFDSLMAGAADEPSSAYGLTARTVSISEDGNLFTFDLREEARFHDGSPLSAADVVFSLNILKEKGHASIRLRLKELAGVEALGDHRVAVRFTGKQSLLLPLYVAGLPIFSAAYWQERDFSASTLEAPLGSGPYKVGRFEQGRYIEYERMDDYWAHDLGVVRGQYNFDVIRLEFFRERIAAFEAFKKGEITWREEFTSKQWATGYDFPAIDDGRVKKTLIDTERRPSLQAWFLNTRRAKFSDPRTREAIGLAFDFEWTNKNTFFNAYARSQSYFEKSDYAARGLPSPAELALLEPYRGKMPEAVFGQAVTPPVSDGSGRDRKLLRRATKLLGEAGWKREGQGLVNDAGERLQITFLINAPVFEIVLGKYVEALKLIGVDASIRLVDAAQYQRRLLDFDFDIVGRAFSMSALPVEDVSTFFHSRTLSETGSSNYAGINDPVVDALLQKVSETRSRAELVVAMRALDRVLRAGHFTVLNWYSPNHRVAHWDMFGFPETKPDYGFPFETTWWYEADKAAAVGR